MQVPSLINWPSWMVQSCVTWRTARDQIRRKCFKKLCYLELYKFYTIFNFFFFKVRHVKHAPRIGQSTVTNTTTIKAGGEIYREALSALSLLSPEKPATRNY